MVPASKGVQVAFDGRLGLADLLGDRGQLGLVLLVQQLGLGAGGGHGLLEQVGLLEGRR